MPLRTKAGEIRERRTLKGLTIVEFAQRMDYSEHHISQVELGHENAGPQFLRRAAEILECTLDDITDGVIPRRRTVKSSPAAVETETAAA